MRISKGATRRANRRPGDYYFGDAALQRRRLEIQIHKINEGRVVKIDVERAVLLMYRRVAKFYGLRNKYPAAKQEHNR